MKEAATLIPRHIGHKLQQLSRAYPVVLITGPRQVGKTTLLRQYQEKDRAYVSLDDMALRQLAIEDPALFVKKYTPPLIIDEIQYAPQLLPYIKLTVDSSATSGMPVPGAYWLTGSQMFSVMKGVSESLSGRVGILPMLGLSNRELLEFSTGLPARTEVFLPDESCIHAESSTRAGLSVQNLYESIFLGGMPALQRPELAALRENFWASYINTYIERDIRDLRHIVDAQAFYSFLTYTAARTGQILNYANIAKELGLSSPTIKQWMSLLVSSGLVYLLEPYSRNIQKRLIKSPKLYFLDTGLASYLTRWTDPATLEAGHMSGSMLETWVVSEIIKSWYNDARRPPLYYYRDSNGTEIDVLLVQDNQYYPLEIKKAAQPDRHLVKKFSALEESGLKPASGGILCFTDTIIPVTELYSFLPFSVL